MVHASLVEKDYLHTCFLTYAGMSSFCQQSHIYTILLFHLTPYVLLWNKNTMTKLRYHLGTEDVTGVGLLCCVYESKSLDLKQETDDRGLVTTQQVFDDIAVD